MLKKEDVATHLILDEVFDLLLYKNLQKQTSGPLRKLLQALIRMETHHVTFWQDFFGVSVSHLNRGRRFKMWCILFICRIFGDYAIQLVLEAIEVHGIQKYISVWEQYKNTKFRKAIEHVLKEEFEHEDKIVKQFATTRINPEKVRNIFLGLNDGLVEIVGAVSGFFAAFATTSSVLVASLTVAVAGALSMGAGAFVASSSEKEIRELKVRKMKFLGKKENNGMEESPFKSSLIVGFSYILGALVPVLPVLFGAQSVLWSAFSAGVVIILVSMILSFLSGMAVFQRIILNASIIAIVVVVTYLIGLGVKGLFGVVI